MQQTPTFFERDLSEAEAERLEAAILADPALAESLRAVAEARYAATGLPEPRWAERGAWRLPKGWLLLAVLAAGVGGWALNVRDTRARVVDVPNVEGSLPVVELLAAPEAREGSESVADAVATDDASSVPPAAGRTTEAVQAPRQGQRLGVVLRLKADADVKVLVRDPQQKLRRGLFEGRVAAGERRFEWDGMDDARRAVGPGQYQIVVLTGGAEMAQPVSIKQR